MATRIQKELMKKQWTVREAGRNVSVFKIDLKHVGDEQWVLLQSDVHWDNPKCDRELLTKHLDLALERNAPVIDAGDWFCAMQGKYDKRSSKKDIRPEHNSDNYLDLLKRTSVDFLEPYKDIITVRGYGNHESAIKKNHETCLTAEMVAVAKDRGFPHISKGGFSGYVKFQVITGGKAAAFKLWYFHGAGGGGPVTRGVIQTNRQAVYVSDADFVFTGHTHDSFQLPISRIRLNSADRIEHCRQTHIKAGGYKEEFLDGNGGWHVERGGPPKPVGAYWIRFHYPKGTTNGQEHRTAEYDLIEAK